MINELPLFTDPIFVDPSFGNREGGTGVVVSGPRFIKTDNVTCIFDDEEVDGVVLSDDNAVLCTTPRLHRTGKIPVKIRLNQILQQNEAYFYSGMHSNNDWLVRTCITSFPQSHVKLSRCTTMYVESNCRH